jgi:hypothetical protein
VETGLATKVSVVSLSTHTGRFSHPSLSAKALAGGHPTRGWFSMIRFSPSSSDDRTMRRTGVIAWDIALRAGCESTNRRLGKHLPERHYSHTRRPLFAHDRRAYCFCLVQYFPSVDQIAPTVAPARRALLGALCAAVSASPNIFLRSRRNPAPAIVR